MKVIVYDFETGGLNAVQHSCLTMGAIFIDLHKNLILTELYFEIRDKPYSVTQEALRINRIKLREHDTRAIWPYFVVDELCENIQRWQHQDDRKTWLAGHNVKFDREFLKRLANRADKPDGWHREVFHDPHICTLETLRLMRMKGHLPAGSNALGNVCQELGIPLRSAHNSREDALATAKLLMRIKEHVPAYQNWLAANRDDAPNVCDAERVHVPLAPE